ncbi:MAG: efflux RND transporter periplasmic adaptor subunit [Elainellaceae cyanobacterium]
MNSISELQPSQRLSRKTGLTLGAIVLLSGLSLVGVRTLTTREPVVQTAPVLGVEAMPVEAAASYTVSRVYAGEVAAGRTSELGFEQGGELVQIWVDRGDRVEAGQPLARLDTRRLAAQRSQLIAQRDRALAQLAELQNGPRREDIDAARSAVQDLENQLELERLRQQRRNFLYTEGAISQEDRDVVAFGADALEDRLAAARSQLEELQTGTRPEQVAAQQAVVAQLSASITDLDIAIEKSTITAPFTGAIAARRLDEGTIVEAGQSVLRLVEQSVPEVEIGLPVEVTANLNLGQTRPLEIGSETYEGTITAILPEVDPTTRTRTVVFQLRGVGNEAVAPEQLAKVTIAQTISTPGFWLPVTALIQGERGLWATYALMPTDGSEESDLFQVQRREVEVLHTEGERAFVRGLLNGETEGGADGGDRIVTDGVQRLVPGQTVRIDVQGS